ncbi:MAG: LptF/LptG family permease [Planctomycetes bacterium]|nr:LptF/LptG family permease [Planctomycetota bacterium]
MKIHDRYLAVAAWKNVTLVLVALVCLMSLAALVGELDDLKGRYGILQALKWVLQTMPERAFDMMVVSALVGGILGFGELAAHNELTMMRAAGRSPRRLAASVLMASLPIVLGLGLLTEFAIPKLGRKAERQRRVAQSGAGAIQTEKDLWIRTGHRMTRIGKIGGDGDFGDVQIFDFNADGYLREVLSAERAKSLPDGNWELYDARRDWAGDPPRTDFEPILVLDSGISADVVHLFTDSPDHLPLSRVAQQLSRKTDSDTPQDRLARSFWRRIGVMLLSSAMLVLALPIALGASSRSSVNARIGIGVVLGVIAQVTIQVLYYLGDIFNLDARLVGLAPVVLATSTALILLRSGR